MDLAFFVYITQQLNILKLKLQGPGPLRAWKPSPQNWDCGKLNFLLKTCHFAACRSLVEEGTTFSGDEYVSTIENLQQEFEERFAVTVCHTVTLPSCLQTASRLMWRVSPACCKLNSSTYSATVKRGAARSRQDCRVSQGAASLIPRAVQSFQSCNVPFWKHIYVWKLFSAMNFTKSKYRTTDAHPEAALIRLPPSEYMWLSYVSRS